jgi:invasion protein IalB|tara:strand:- start:8462 stop:8977 length:516 start_codon:yes stop_codon:yes gene_type:complete
MRRIVFSVLSLTALALFSVAGFAPSAQAADEKAWDVRCKTNETDKKEYCEMFQMITVKDTGQRFMEIALFKDKEDKLGGIIILPLGLLVANPVLMQVDGGEKNEGEKNAFNFHTCTPGGCLGRIGVTEVLLKEMRKGNNLVLATHDQTGKVFSVKLSLSGFSKAHKELMKK